MRIDEMTLDQATDVTIRISASMTAILEDKDVQNLFNAIGEKDEKTSVMEWISKYLPKITTLALQKHKNDLFEIVGALSQTDISEVGKMNFRTVVDLLKENWVVLQGFFTSSLELTEPIENQ